MKTKGFNLVTGGTGFIGSHLIARLCARGERIRCVAKHRMNASALEDLGVETVLGDLGDDIDFERLLEGVDRVYHLAGVTRARDTSDYYEGNVVATRRLLEACARHARDIRRFVYVSSLAAVGPSDGSAPIDEKARCRPVSEYGKSKLMGEMETMSMRDCLPVTIVRPSAVYGPRDGDFLRYFRLVKHHLRLIAGVKPRHISVIHVDDLVDGLILAGTHERAENEVFFIAGESFTTDEFALEIARAMHARTMAIHVPSAFVCVTGAILEAAGKLTGREVLFNRQKARELVQPSWICSVAKAVERLGFHPRVGLQSGLRATLDWYLQARWL